MEKRRYFDGFRLPPFDLDRESLDMLRNWFNCDLRKLPRNSFADNFLNKGLRSKSYHVCTKSMMGTNNTKTTIRDFCVRELATKCLESPVKIIKTIRLPMRLVEHLFSVFPNLKVVHLVRDPRATLSSQRRMGMCSSRRGGWPNCSERLCKRIEKDIIDKEMLMKKYPKRIMTLLYEDLALRPLQTSKALYKFVGTTFTTHADKYIFNITMAGNPNNCLICTTRSNSSSHIGTWKKTLSQSFIDMVQQKCQYTLNRYKYEFV